MHKTLLGAFVALTTSLAGEANAATFTVTVPDIGDYQFLGTGDAAVTYDGVTFSQSAALSNGNFFNVSSGFSGAPAVLSSQEQSFGVPNILVTLPSLADMISITYGTFGGSPVTFTLSSGASSVLPSTGSGYLTPDIYTSGLASPFTSVQVTTTDSVLHISSITYSTSVPEPATWAMMLVGLGGIGFAMRNRRQQTIRIDYA